MLEVKYKGRRGGGESLWSELRPPWTGSYQKKFELWEKLPTKWCRLVSTLFPFPAEAWNIKEALIMEYFEFLQIESYNYFQE